jgi:hypothetical protein
MIKEGLSGLRPHGNSENLYTGNSKDSPGLRPDGYTEDAEMVEPGNAGLI